MRTTLDLDAELLREALAVTGARTKTEVLELGLRALIEHAARQKLKALHGKLPGLRDVSRRRA